LATSGDGTNNFSYGYDRWGNRWNQTVTKGCGPQPSYSFNTNNQSGSFTYDAAGNITNDGAHTYSYDAEGRVLTVDGGSTDTYVYNSRGMRAAIVGSEFLFDLSGNIVSAVTPGTTTLLYNRYTVGGRLLAANASGSTYFYHQDWLGGIRLTTNLNGTSDGACTNLPFGDSPSCNSWYFAGLMYDSWDNLNTSATRSESPTSGRWLRGLASVDPSNPQTWNRYAYVTNNPVSFVDPLGLDGDDSGGGDSGMPGGPAGIPAPTVAGGLTCLVCGGAGGNPWTGGAPPCYMCGGMGGGGGGFGGEPGPGGPSGGPSGPTFGAPVSGGGGGFGGLGCGSDFLPCGPPGVSGLTLPCDFGVCNPIGNGFLGTGLPSNPGPYQFALPIYLLGDLLYGFNGNPPTLSRNPLAYQSCLNSALSDRRWCKAAITVAYGIPAGIVDVGCFGVGGPGAEILCLNLTQGSLLVPAAIGWNGCNAAYQQAAGSCSTQRMGPP